MPTRIRVIHGRVERIRIPIVTLRVLRAGHNRIRADESPNPRQVIPGIHVDQANVVAAGVVVLVPGIPPVGDAWIDAGRGRAAVAPIGIIPGIVAVDPGAVAPSHGVDAALPVAVDEVERARLSLRLDPHGDQLPGQAVMDTLDGRASGRYLLFVLREGRVDPAGLGGSGLVNRQNPVAVGIVVKFRDQVIRPGVVVAMTYEAPVGR